MSPLVRTEDLIDARGVAEILGLAQPNSVSLYQRRYPGMPRPIINLGPKRPMLWRRAEVEAWAASRTSNLQLRTKHPQATAVSDGPAPKENPRADGLKIVPKPAEDLSGHQPVAKRKEEGG